MLPDWYQAEQAKQAMPTHPAWRALREAATSYLATHGLPTGGFGKRSSYWQYTDLAAWMHETPLPDVAIAPQSHLPAPANACCLNMQDGLCEIPPSLEWSDGCVLLSEGVTLYDLAQCGDAVWDDWMAHHDVSIERMIPDGMAALNWACHTRLYWLKVAPHAAMDQPLLWQYHLLASAHTTQYRLFVHMGSGSRLTWMESVAGQAHQHWLQTAVDWRLSGGAQLHCVQAQCAAQDGARICMHHRVEQAVGSMWHAACLHTGAVFARHAFESDLLGEGADFQVRALAHLAGSQSHDWVVRANHLKPGASSRVNGRALLHDHAVHACNPKAYVAQGAKQSEAHQHSQHVIMSDRARGHAKPTLVIEHDDVICSHGATVGALSQEAEFFLRARGVPRHLARQMLIQAFAQALLDEMTLAGWRDSWSQRFQHAMLASVPQASEVAHA